MNELEEGVERRREGRAREAEHLEETVVPEDRTFEDVPVENAVVGSLDHEAIALLALPQPGDGFLELSGAPLLVFYEVRALQRQRDLGTEGLQRVLDLVGKGRVAGYHDPARELPPDQERDHKDRPQLGLEAEGVAEPGGVTGTKLGSLPLEEGVADPIGKVTDARLFALDLRRVIARCAYTEIPFARA